ncbi:LemA family membrane protein [Weissella oryzae SG25]|uniref:LemA family membrane protein n=1 Tax=Weissella oryzae (strain DSM 25784 / JCM 18191 / LMG 30913 / SG25) TaxID=1329250 RepID=A0A069CSW5_WEIOS|nr:LemA family protein [Weissella oryzae]GAK30569.1 LemA family membrane protein [Weissella oryzae SG25]
MTILIIVAIVIVLAVLWVSIYNGLVKSRMYTTEAWSQIDVQLKRRNDLIPNLLETVKGYARFEQGTLEKVIGLRNQLMNVPTGADPKQTMEISDQLTAGLKSIFAVGEAYPDLKASNQYNKLMEELSNTENKIAYSRQLFNTATANYNMKLQSFPTNIVAGVHGFKPSEFLTTPAEEKAVPDISFNDEGM